MNAEESVSFGHPLIQLVGDGHEALHRFDFSAAKIMNDTSIVQGTKVGRGFSAPRAWYQLFGAMNLRPTRDVVRTTGRGEDG